MAHSDFKLKNSFETFISSNSNHMDLTKPRCNNGLPWNNKSFTNSLCQGNMNIMPNGDIKISGVVNDMNVNKIMFWASAPPTYGTSFSGSGMPYPDPLTAFDRTPNRGSVNVVNREFSFTVKYPNAYYIGLGTLYVPPHVNIKFCQVGIPENSEFNKKVSIQVDEGIPYRTLTYPAPPSKKPRVSPLFYCEPWHGARTQEEILRGAGYPEVNKTPDNFWGTKPPR
jgi:hypothetical protein